MTLNEISNNKIQYSKNIINFNTIKNNEELEYMPIIYSGRDGEVKCVYKEINYIVDNFVYNYHSFSSLNFLSNLNYDMKIKLENKNGSEIELPNDSLIPNSISSINMIIKKENNNSINKEFKYKINFLKNNESIINIDCNININSSEFIIFLSCKEYELIYNEKEKFFEFKNMEFLNLNEEINLILNTEYDSIIILPKIALISNKETNTASKPNLIIDNNRIKFIINEEQLERDAKLDCKANIYFTNDFYITLIFNTTIIANYFTFLGYDYNKNKYIGEEVFLYLTKNYLLENKEFIYSQYIFIEYKSNKKEFYEIEINEINGIELLDNKKILKGELFREKIIKLTFKITKDFIKNIENNNKNSIIIQCSIKNMDKKIIIEINDQLIEEQEFKICYQIESEKEAKELNNITYKKIKKKLNIIYTGIIQDTTYYINYTNKKIDNSFDGDVEVMSFEPNEQEIKMIKKNNFDNNNGKIILIYGIINILDWFPITIKFNRIFNIWLDFYKNNNFEAKKK